MKHIITGMLSSILMVGSLSAVAAPYHYTFSGNIEYIEFNGEYLSYIDIDDNPATTNDNFQAGEVIEYTFLVDFDLPGFCAGPLGTTYSATCTGVDIPDSETANYFFTDLVSATKLAPPTEEGTTFNYGLSISNLGSLVADSAVFIVSPYNVSVENWVASDATMSGTILIGTDAWAAPNGGSPYGRINSTLILTSIVPVVLNPPAGECSKDEDHKKKKNKHHAMKKKHHDKNDHHSDDDRKKDYRDHDEDDDHDDEKHSKKDHDTDINSEENECKKDDDGHNDHEMKKHDHKKAVHSKKHSKDRYSKKHDKSSRKNYHSEGKKHSKSNRKKVKHDNQRYDRKKYSKLVRKGKNNKVRHMNQRKGQMKVSHSSNSKNRSNKYKHE